MLGIHLPHKPIYPKLRTVIQVNAQGRVNIRQEVCGGVRDRHTGELVWSLVDSYHAATGEYALLLEGKWNTVRFHGAMRRNMGTRRERGLTTWV